MRMTAKELIAEARVTAPTLPPAAAKLMTAMADRLDLQFVALCESRNEVKQLAAENAALKNALEWIYETVSSDCVSIPDDKYSSVTNAAQVLSGISTTDHTLSSEGTANAIPEGYAVVPKQIHLDADAVECICSQGGDGGFAYGDFTDVTLWVGEVENDDGSKTHGLNVSSADYPEEGSINLCEFAAQLRSKSEVQS
ncbi:hypothetical protein ACR9H8_11370 [Kosakonia cowanii]